MAMGLKRVVVTGAGALTPIGSTLPAFWEALAAGTSGSAPITHFDASKFKTRIACEVKGYDPQNHFDRKEVRKLDLYTQYAMVAAHDYHAPALSVYRCEYGDHYHFSSR